MIFTNLHLLTLIIFLGVLLLGGYFLYILYRRDSRQVIALVILFCSLLTLAITIFEPRGDIQQTATSHEGLKVSFVLDVSKSMNVYDIEAKDGYISRLSAAKQAMTSVVTSGEYNEYALGVFAGEYLEILPFTSDTSIFKTLLSGLDDRNVSVAGTKVYGAIQKSIDNFPDEDKRGIVVIFTDGGDQENYTTLKGNKDIQVLVVGVGTQKGGYIPIGRDVFGKLQYKIYQGKRVISQLHTENLQEMISQIGGQYLEISDITDIDRLISKIGSMGRGIMIDEDRDSRTDLSYIYITISMFLFILYLFMYMLGKRK